MPPSPPGLQVTIHEGAKAAYLVHGSTWVGFDLPQTIWMKILAARERGLGGLMVRCARCACCACSAACLPRRAATCCECLLPRQAEASACGALGPHLRRKLHAPCGANV
jgi:hypothetical protein